MKLRFKKLNQLGFDHMVGLAAFVVLFAGVGTYLVVASHAATAATTVELKLNGNNVCFTGTNIETCTTSDSDMLFIKPAQGSSNFQLKTGAGYCVDDWNAAYQTKTLAQGGTRTMSRLYTCNAKNNDPNEQWSWRGTANHELANAGSKYQGCLNAAGATTTPGTPVIMYQCNNSWNENWIEAPGTVAAGAVNPKPWGLAGTTTQSSTSTGKITFTSVVKNLGPNVSGTFAVGPRYFYSSTANPVPGSNGAYAGEVSTVANKSFSSLKSGASVTGITQSVTVPSTSTSAYICGTVAFSPYNYQGNTNGRSAAVCMSVPKLLGKG